MKPGHVLKDLYLVSSFQLLAIAHKLGTHTSQMLGKHMGLNKKS